MRFIKPILCILALSVSACANSATSSRQFSSQHFTAMVASSDQFEIASSRMALAKSHNKNVRTIARHMIADHTQSSNELKTLLASNGMPTPPARMIPKQADQLDVLSKTRPFNGAYLDAQEKAHAEAIALFEKYRENGDNDQLRGFAEKTLPVLRQHYQMIEEMKK